MFRSVLLIDGVCKVKCPYKLGAVSFYRHPLFTAFHQRPVSFSQRPCKFCFWFLLTVIYNIQINCIFTIRSADHCLLVKPFCIVVKDFPPIFIINPGPGCPWKAIYNLPVQASHASWLHPPEMTRPIFDSFCLCILRRIYIFLKISRRPDLLKDIIHNLSISHIAVIITASLHKIHDLWIRTHILRLHIMPECFYTLEGFQSKFAYEPGFALFIECIWFCRQIPDIPAMHISFFISVRILVSSSAGWWARPV